MDKFEEFQKDTGEYLNKQEEFLKGLTEDERKEAQCCVFGIVKIKGEEHTFMGGSRDDIAIMLLKAMAENDHYRLMIQATAKTFDVSEDAIRSMVGIDNQLKKVDD